MTTYTHLSPSPLGGLLLSADDTGLTGLWFEDQKYYAAGLTSDIINTKTCSEHPIFTQTQKWLNLYFKGMEPDFTVPIHLTGTDFQKKYGHFFWKFLMVKPQLTEHSPRNMPKSMDFRICLPKRWEVQLVITKSAY